MSSSTTNATANRRIRTRTREAKESRSFGERNTELFELRIPAKAEVARLDKALERTREGSVANRRLKRELRQAKAHLDMLTAEIVELNYGLVRDYVRPFRSNSRNGETEDYEGAGLVGLMVAIDTYDPARGKFSSWSYKPIQREVLRCVGSTEFGHMNHGDFEKRPDILRAARALTEAAADGEEISYARIAEEAGATFEQVRRVMEARNHKSLDAPVTTDDSASTFGEMIPDEAASLEDSVLSKIGVETIADHGLPNLDARELFVLVRRYGLDGEPRQRLAAIGEMLGLSREAVRQIQSKALAKIAHPVVLRTIARDGRDVAPLERSA